MSFPSLLRASLRHYRRHPLQLALALVGVALGVAVVVGVDIAAASARVSLDEATAAVAGEATHAVIGGPAGLPDSVYRVLRVDARIDGIAPVVEGLVRWDGIEPARSIRVLGIDPFADASFRGFTGSDVVDRTTLLARPGALLVSSQVAAELGVTVGDSLRIWAGGIARDALIGGVLEPRDELSRRALSDLAIADIATAQELLGRAGWIDRIDVLAPVADRASYLARIEAALPAGARLMDADDRARATAELSRAFEINLRGLALLALVFGAFLIYNSIGFAVVQRRPLLGQLRALGVTRRELVLLVLAEALLIGVTATTIGLAAGAVLAQGLIGLVTQTLNDLYYRVAVSGLTVPVPTAMKAVALGIGATVLAGLAPALEAARVPPRAALSRSALEERARRGVAAAAVAGIVIGSGALLVLTLSASLTVGFVALFGVIFAAALLTPLSTAGVMRVLTAPLGRVFGLSGRMAARGVAAALSRTGPAIAALAVAIAVGAAVGLMITAFRGSVVRWLDATLRADVYVSAPALGAEGRSTIEPSVLERLISTPEVLGATTYRHTVLSLEGRDAQVTAVDLYDAHRAAFTFLDGPGESAWRAFDDGGVIITEPYSYRTGLARGDTLVLPTDRGRQAFPIGGVVLDYASEHGVIFMDRATYDAAWTDDGVSSVALFARPGIEADALVARLRERAGLEQDIFVRSDRALRDATLAVFDRTFAITAVLRLLALAVAFVGVLAALMALQLERARELGILRAVGMTPAGVRGLVILQTGLVGLAAGLLALPIGTTMAWLMIDAINKRAFGWTIPFSVEPGLLLQAVLLAVGSALLAGLYPAFRMAHVRTAAALREE